MPSPFVKGNKLGKGRPKGSVNKDTQNYLDLQLWFKKAVTDLESIEKPEIRIGYVLQIMDKLLGKVQNLPSTPGDSLANALKSQERIKALEQESENVALG